MYKPNMKTKSNLSQDENFQTFFWLGESKILRLETAPKKKKIITKQTRSQPKL